MNEPELLDLFRELLFREFGVRKECVTPEADLVADLGADSLSFLGLVLEMEQRFSISFTADDAEAIRTVGDAIRYVSTHLRDGKAIAEEQEG